MFRKTSICHDHGYVAPMFAHAGIYLSHGSLVERLLVALALHGNSLLIFAGNDIDTIVTTSWGCFCPVALCLKQRFYLVFKFNATHFINLSDVEC